ncbi:MAG: ATP-binding protein [Caldimonas sp.]
MSGAVLIFRDVTERRRLARDLEQREEQFRTLAESIPQLCWMARADGHIYWYNRRWYDYTGTTLEQMEGWGWQSVHDPEVLPAVMKRWQASIEHGEPFEKVFPLKGADRRFRDFLTRVTPVKDDIGITRWFGTNTEISIITKTQQELREREQELRTLTDNTPDILTRFDRQLRHVFVNAAIERVTGRQPSELVGKTNRELDFPAELCDMWDVATRKVFETASPQWIEFRFVGPAGPRDFITQLIPEKEIDGRILHVLAVSHDRTVELAAQTALQDADRKKDEFLATLAHELRNPLAPIRTGLHVLQRSQDLGLTRRTQEMMSRQLGHMVRLIDDLLDVSRITSGKVILRKERVTLRAIVESSIEATRSLLEAAEHKLRVDLPNEPLWLDVDATRISQVLSNLLTNAAKYSPDQASISLAARQEGDQIVVSVSDNGVGIPRDMLTQVFDMFAQVNKTLDRAQGGLGIGLSLAKRLIEMHGGSIGATSAGEDCGSTFTFRLPAAAPRMGTQAPLESGISSGPSLRALVIDDNIDAAEALAALLQLLGHETSVATSGPAGLAMAIDAEPQVIFLDIGMPGMNGFEVASRLRAMPGAPRSILVAVTGWGSEDDRKKAKEAGFDFHLTKPTDDAELEAILAQVQEKAERSAPG